MFLNVYMPVFKAFIFYCVYVYDFRCYIIIYLLEHISLYCNGDAAFCFHDIMNLKVFSCKYVNSLWFMQDQNNQLLSS